MSLHEVLCSRSCAPHAHATPNSQERPTMILYGIDNIRDLFGHKVNLNMIKKNPLCRLGL